MPILDKDLLEVIASEMKAGHFHCALCLRPFETHEEKIAHMESVHGYTTLEVTYVKPEVYNDS